MRSERDVPQGRDIRRSLLTVILIALVAALCLVGLFVGGIVYQRAAADQEALNQLHASVADARDRLRSAAGDGILTDKEIHEALRMSQASVEDTVRTPHTVTVKALVHGTQASALGGGEVSRCRAFRAAFTAEGVTVSDMAAEGCY